MRRTRTCWRTRTVSSNCSLRNFLPPSMGTMPAACGFRSIIAVHLEHLDTFSKCSLRHVHEFLNVSLAPHAHLVKSPTRLRYMLKKAGRLWCEAKEVVGLAAHDAEFQALSGIQ